VLRRVEIGGLIATADPEDILISYALGSCLGLAIYDPVARVGGMIHSKVPMTRQARPEIGGGPATCADQGATLLLQALFDLGARKSRLIVSVAGCGNPVKSITHDIGQRNYTVARKVLWKNGLFIHAEDVGGEKPRTISLDIATGDVYISSRGEKTKLA
jgi:chemotaxis protein CheD